MATAFASETLACASSSAESSTIDLSRFKMKDATRKETPAATRIPAQTLRIFPKPPAALPEAIPVMAIIEPGDAGA